MKKAQLLTLWKESWIQYKNIERIIMKKTGLSNEQFFLMDNIDINEAQIKDIKNSFKKLNFGFPFEYIIELADFYWWEFYVDSRCLIPRDDTEVMVDEAVKTINKTQWRLLYIDVWTWSWAIPISVVKNTKNLDLPSLWIDISNSALEVATINISNYKLENEITLLQSDLLNTIFEWDFCIDVDTLVITANLPYIKDSDYWNMDKDVILHEPSVALYGWKDTWFELYESLITQIFKLKKKNTLQSIILFIEIWFDQKKVAVSYLNLNRLSYKIFFDNSGVERCIKIWF